MIKKSKVKVARCNYVANYIWSHAGTYFFSHLSFYMANVSYVILCSDGYSYANSLSLVREGDIISFTLNDEGTLIEFTNHTLTGK